MAGAVHQVKFEDDEIEAVYFMNPLDAADYLGDATIITQNAFGMSYVENFLGLGTVIFNSSVTKGKIYATAKQMFPDGGVAVYGRRFSDTNGLTGTIPLSGRFFSVFFYGAPDG